MNTLSSRSFSLFSVCMLSVLGLWLSGCSSDNLPPAPVPKPIKLVVDLEPERLETVSYTGDVKPILDARCISCHACYDAPGQLKLNSAAGIRRGASKARVYGVDLSTRPTTRLYEDAVNEEGWRDLGFFRVLCDPDAVTPEERLDSSVLYQMLAMARLRRLPEQGLLDGIVRDSHDVPQAPTIEEFPAYAHNFPHAGMPFYTYGLEEEEFLTLAHWIGAGAPIDDEDVSLTPLQQERVDAWEALLNGDSIKDRTIARYLYEHWFAASLYLEEGEGRPDFFSIVRSRTPPGEPVDRIVTRRPNDGPGSEVKRVYYRLLKRPDTIMRKNHLPYALTPAKMERIKELFWESKYAVPTLPKYGSDVAQRPLELFSAIPESVRYQFLLDDSFYYIQSYIRGPVCRGQVALSVIWDHFFVYFLDPSADPASNDPEFAARTREQLRIPSHVKKIRDIFVEFGYVKKGLKGYWEERDAYFNKQPALGLDQIWKGGRETDIPFMTVFRHFDTATVEPGLLGETPSYGWFVDYDLFERIYYLLVVNFDVFGPATHQVATRQYFDLLRFEGEMNYLRLFPADQRQAIYDHWYDGVSKGKKKDTYPFPEFGVDTDIVFSGKKDVQDELRDLLMDLSALPQSRHPQSVDAQPLVRSYRQVNQDQRNYVQFFPEVTFVRIERKGKEDEVYTFLRNKAHQNIAYLFGEDKKRVPQKDSLVMVPGLVGDYPNFMMVLNEDELDSLRETMNKVDSMDRMFDAWLSHGILRNSPEFWPALDAFTEWELKNHPIQGGRFDLKHYYLTRMLMLEQADLVPGPDLSGF